MFFDDLVCGAAVADALDAAPPGLSFALAAGVSGQSRQTKDFLVGQAGRYSYNSSFMLIKNCLPS